MSKQLINIKHKARIAFCVPYYGTLPVYMKLFLLSCKYNKSINFLIFTDVQTSNYENIADNVSFIHYPAEQLYENIYLKTGFKIPKNPHKLCDIKPFYGLIFSEYLENYDFWGYCDIDIILGNVDKIITDELLSNVDIFSANDDIIVGHFAIFRNLEHINTIAFNVPDCKNRLENIATTTFIDEGAITVVVGAMNNIRWVRTPSARQGIADNFVQCGLTFDYNGKLHELKESTGNEYCKWENGKLYLFYNQNDKVEIFYYHFMAMKLPIYWQQLDKDKQYEIFYLTPLGFSKSYDSKGITTLIRLLRNKFLMKSKSLIGKILNFILPPAYKLRVVSTIKKIISVVL